MRTHTHIHMLTHTQNHTHIDTHTHTQTRRHTYIHTHTHIHNRTSENNQITCNTCAQKVKYRAKYVQQNVQYTYSSRDFGTRFWIWRRLLRIQKCCR